MDGTVTAKDQLGIPKSNIRAVTKF